MTRQEALDIIKANPGCIAVLDNDCWSIERPQPAHWDAMSDDEKDIWLEEEGTLISSLDVDECDYGGGLVEVLALEFGLKCEDA